MMDRWDVMDGFGATGSLWMFLAVVLIGLVVVISVWLIVRSNRVGSPPASNAMEILRERFARGEITQEEFEAARKALGG